MGFVVLMNFLCVPLPFEMAIKSGRQWGSSILQTSSAPLFLLTRDEIKKAQHLWRCSPLNALTQGSSLRSPTLGYQKQNPYGVHQSANILCAHSSFRNSYQKQKAMGFVNLQTSFAPLLVLKEMKLKKRNTYGVVFHATY